MSMTSKFGPHGALVAEFLGEVRTRDIDWPQFADAANTDTVRAAMEATSSARWSTSMQGAVYQEALDTFKSLNLARSDFGAPMAMSRVRNMIQVAAKVIALEEQITAETASTVLRPFADAGVTSAAAALTGRE
jgi:hypothetical protein